MLREPIKTPSGYQGLRKIEFGVGFQSWKGNRDRSSIIKN
jgi:hypothetical protein